MTGPEAARHVGITYRQLDHWYHRGWIGDSSNVSPSTGNARQVTDTELTRLKQLAALVRAGLRPDRAALLLDTAQTTPTGIRLSAADITIDLHEQHEHIDVTGPSGLAETA